MTLYDLGGLKYITSLALFDMVAGSLQFMYYNNAIMSIVYFIKTVMCLYSVELNLQ